MKITVSKKDLNDALKVVLKACPVKAAVQIFTGILIDASAGRIKLQSTDNKISISSTIFATCEEEGRVVLVGKNFAAICAKLSGENVTINYQKENSTAEIISDSAKFSLLAMNADDFPAIKNFDPEKRISFTENQFVRLIKKVAFAVATNDERPLFTCVNFNWKRDENTLRLAATDTHRLAAEKFVFSYSIDLDDFNVNVPAKELLAVTSSIPQTDYGNVFFGVNEKYFSIKFDNYSAAIRLVEGQFPPYEKVIPKESTTIAQISVERFKKVLERINVVAAESDYKTCRMIFEKSELDDPFEESGLLKISATSNTVGKVEESFPIKLKGNSVDISFTVNNWLDALKVIDSLGVVIGLTEPLKPVDVRQTVGKDFNTNDKFVYIATPVRTSN